MKTSRSFLRLLSFLLLIGQQAGLLHHLGHDLDAAARVAVLADAAGGAAGQGVPESDGHGGTCVLCIGFGGVAASAPLASFEPPQQALGFARPLADAPNPRPVALTGTPIRGPPQAFSVHV